MIFDFIFVYFLLLLNETYWTLETQAHTARLGAHKGALSRRHVLLSHAGSIGFYV